MNFKKLKKGKLQNNCILAEQKLHYQFSCFSFSLKITKIIEIIL
jgi:hypothetical protein